MIISPVFLAVFFGIILLLLTVLNKTTPMELKTEIEIQTSTQEVWDVLTDTQKYAEWNPFITSITGEMKLGAYITNVMVNKGKENTFTPIITVLEENTSLEWLGSGLGGTFKGNHYFHLTELPNGHTKIIHGEKFSGLLSGLIMQIIGKDTLASFVLMNNAMKNRVESN